MITVELRGLNFNNLKDETISMASSVDESVSGSSMQLQILDKYDAGEIITHFSDNYDVDLKFEDEDYMVVSKKGEETREYQCEEESEEEDEEDYEEDDEDTADASSIDDGIYNIDNAIEAIPTLRNNLNHIHTIEPLKSSREDFKNIIDNNYQNSNEGIKRSINELANQISKQRNYLLNLERKLSRLYSDGGYVDPSEIFNQIDNVRSFDQVKSVKFDSNFINVETDDLISNEISGQRYKIGKMLIKIPVKYFYDIEHCTESIKIFNLTNIIVYRGAVYQAPHTGPDGDSCYGNAGPMINKSIINKKFNELVHILIRFIESPDPSDSMGKSILAFPKYYSID